VRESAGQGTVSAMKSRMPLFFALAPVLVCASQSLVAADELLAEDSGPVPGPSCYMVACATVLTIRHEQDWEPAPPASGPGFYVGEADIQTLDPDDPTSPIVDEEDTEVKASELWDIEVSMQDGSVRHFEQDFPPLFHAGDRVVVEGEQLRLLDVPAPSQ
jgi:hypothetical protein